jgi:hypothetical protein
MFRTTRPVARSSQPVPVAVRIRTSTFGTGSTNTQSKDCDVVFDGLPKSPTLLGFAVQHSS